MFMIRREIFDLSIACFTKSRMYSGDFATDFSHNGPDLTSSRCWRCVIPVHLSRFLYYYALFSVEAVKLTGITSKEESRSILTRLNPANGKVGAGGQTQKDIKLCYVTVS
jgi:hypothetical protein